MEPVHQQPHGVDGEEPQLAALHGRSSVTAASRHRPDGAEAQAAPDEIRQLGGHGANWFELNKLLSIEK